MAFIHSADSKNVAPDPEGVFSPSIAAKKTIFPAFTVPMRLLAARGLSFAILIPLDRIIKKPPAALL